MADFSLSQWEFDVLWADMDCGPPPFPLRVGVHGATISEWEQMREKTRGELRNRGLVDSGNGVEGILKLLAEPRTAIDLIGYDEGPIQAVATGNAHSGVLASQSADKVELTEVRPTALVASVVGRLPDCPAGSGKSIALRHAEALRATSDDEDDDDPFGDDSERDALVRAGVPAEDAAQLVSLAENRFRGGQIGVSVADHVGPKLRRAAVTITWFDTTSGRYLLVRDGEWLSVAPADANRISHRIDEVLESELG